MLKAILKFSSFLVIVLSVVFAMHLLVLYLLELSLFADRIVTSYIVNLILAVVIYAVMLLLKEKFLNQLGFIFMFGSFFKFIVFFIVLYPFYKADGIITKTEFASFFIPYVVCLIIEISSLSKWLNKMG